MELEQLKAGGEENRSRIAILETKIKERIERQRAILECGRKLCDGIRGGGTTAGWASATTKPPWNTCVPTAASSGSRGEKP